MIEPLWLTEKHAIAAALVECPSIVLCAKRLRVARSTLYRKIAFYGLRSTNENFASLSIGPPTIRTDS